VNVLDSSLSESARERVVDPPGDPILHGRHSPRVSFPMHLGHKLEIKWLTMVLTINREFDASILKIMIIKMLSTIFHFLKFSLTKDFIILYHFAWDLTRDDVSTFQTCTRIFV
jgi:hypothetical protein